MTKKSRRVSRGLEAPERQIAENAGAEGSIIVGKLRETPEFGLWRERPDKGVRRPLQTGREQCGEIVRTALKDAASVAGLLVTTEAMVAEKPKKETPVR